MEIGAQLNEIFKRSRFTKSEVAERIGMSPQNFSKLLAKKSIDAKVLNDICEVLRVCPLDFFDYKGEGCKPYHIDHNSGIQHNEGNVTMIDENVLKILLSEKEKRIKDLSDQVDRLWNQVENAHNKD